jgi:hypothetical protein
MSDQSKPRYPWYEPVEDNSLEQGDFVDDCEILIPKYSFPTSLEATSSTPSTFQVDGDADIFDVVIINQTCDLQTKAPLPFVVVCPRWPYSQFKQEYPNLANRNDFEQVRKGKNHRYFMLNKCDLFDLAYEIQIVDLAKVFIIPIIAMKQMALLKDRRVRLCSPYKEKLAQAFAFYYMRVASPIDIDEYDILYPDQAHKKHGH